MACAWKPSRDRPEQVRLPPHVKHCGGVAVTRPDFEGIEMCDRHYDQARKALRELRDFA